MQAHLYNQAPIVKFLLQNNDNCTEYQKLSLKSLMEISNTCCLEYIQRLIDEISLQVKFCIVLYTWSCSWLSCCNLQTHAVENAESAEVKECRAEEAGVGRTTGREETEASTEGPRYTVWYVFIKSNLYFL